MRKRMEREGERIGREGRLLRLGRVKCFVALRRMDVPDITDVPLTQA